MRNNCKSTKIVLRLKPTIRIRWDDVDVIHEHRVILERKGVVALGKFGAAMPVGRCEELAAALRQGSEIWLYLVWKQAAVYKAVRALVQDLFLAGDRRKQFPICPDYYAKLQTKPSLWFVLIGQLESASLDHLRLLSNNRPLLHVLRECRTTLMLVSETVGNVRKPKKSCENFEARLHKT